MQAGGDPRKRPGSSSGVARLAETDLGYIQAGSQRQRDKLEGGSSSGMSYQTHWAERAAPYAVNSAWQRGLV